MGILASTNTGRFRHPNPHFWFELVIPTRGYYQRLTLEELEWLLDEPTPRFEQYEENKGHNYNGSFDWKWLWKKEIRNKKEEMQKYKKV